MSEWQQVPSGPQNSTKYSSWFSSYYLFIHLFYNWFYSLQTDFQSKTLDRQRFKDLVDIVRLS